MSTSNPYFSLARRFSPADQFDEKLYQQTICYAGWFGTHYTKHDVWQKAARDYMDVPERDDLRYAVEQAWYVENGRRG